jgi:hypothetical protein
VVRTGSLRTQSARHRVDHGTICGRSCANSGHYKPLCACVDRTFVNPQIRRAGVQKKFSGTSWRRHVRRNVDVIVTRGTPSARLAQRSYAHRFRCGCDAYTAQRVVGDSKNTIILTRSSADVSPPYGFMLWPGTTSSGFAMNRSSFSLSHTKSAPFMALE